MSTKRKINPKDMNIVHHKYPTTEQFEKRVMKQYRGKKLDYDMSKHKYTTRQDIANAIVGAQLKRTRSKHPPKRRR